MIPHKVFNLKLTRSVDILRAALLLACARIAVTRNSPNKLLDLTGRETSVPVVDSNDIDVTARITRITWSVQVAARLVPWRADCLVQAVAVQNWLRRIGVRSHLNIGVRKDPVSGFEAHAWVMQESVLVIGGDVSGFTPLISPDP
jgi:hypothetical protein